MGVTTAAQFARQLRRLGAATTVREGTMVTATYRGIEVTSHFRADTGAFRDAYRSDGAGEDAEPIRSMAAVRRVLRLPKQPILTLGTTGRRNSRTTSCAGAGKPSPNAASASACHTPKVGCARSPAAGAAPSGGNAEHPGASPVAHTHGIPATPARGGVPPRRPAKEEHVVTNDPGTTDPPATLTI